MPKVSTKIEYWYGEEERRARKNNLAYTMKVYPRTISREFKGLAHAELVMMFPERFQEEVTRFLREEYTLASDGPYCDCGYKKKGIGCKRR